MSQTVLYYQKELKRIAWRLGYRARSERRREMPLKLDSIQMLTSSPEHEVDSKLYVEYLLSLIPSETGQRIVRLFYIEGRSEAEISKQMNISQQAVNKWKRKSIQTISQKMSS
ncbi:hypothetical protein M3231_17065 [Neobacillus mesonae]|nr:hypothetical protein [Neobacillus mesonae]